MGTEKEKPENYVEKPKNPSHITKLESAINKWKSSFMKEKLQRGKWQTSNMDQSVITPADEVKATKDYMTQYDKATSIEPDLKKDEFNKRGVPFRYPGKHVSSEVSRTTSTKKWQQ